MPTRQSLAMAGAKTGKASIGRTGVGRGLRLQKWRTNGLREHLPKLRGQGNELHTLRAHMNGRNVARRCCPATRVPSVSNGNVPGAHADRGPTKPLKQTSIMHHARMHFPSRRGGLQAPKGPMASPPRTAPDWGRGCQGGGR